MKEHILLIAYQFCPKGQIGTRRWSKFAKYLSQKDYIVHVICASYHYKDEINWCHDVENNPSIIIHRIPPMYPVFLLQPKRTFLIKLFDRIFSHTIYAIDKAQHWGGVMIPKAKKIIKRFSIQHVLVTGAPFSTFGHAANLKKELPNINLILDYRDPWKVGKSSNLFNNFFVQKKSKKIEKFSISMADKVLLTTESVRANYAKLYPQLSYKFDVLSNGYDNDDFDNSSDSSHVTDFSIIYTGSLMKARAEAFLLLINALIELNDDFLAKHFKLHIYGYDFNLPDFPSTHIQAIFNKYIKHKGTLSSKKIISTIQKYTFCLSVNAKSNPDIIVAKTFDYFGAGKKVFLISEEGPLNSKLKAKNHYVANYSIESIKKALLAMKSDFLAKKIELKKEFPEYEYNHLTQELISHLKK